MTVMLPVGSLAFNNMKLKCHLFLTSKNTAFRMFLEFRFSLKVTKENCCHGKKLWQEIGKGLHVHVFKKISCTLVAARRGKNVWSRGKPPAPNSVSYTSYVPQHIDERPAM